ncbi:MAG: hypothetical protein ACJ8FY_23295 [Gemmataceae bacterium]
MASTFVPAITRLGFDETASPPWLMVPAAGGTKTVILRDGDGLSLNIAKTGIVTFKELSPTPAGRPIVITGANPGTVRLEATGSGQATLEITVKAQKRLSTFIHFVFDKSQRSSNKGAPEAREMMELANKLLAPWVNVMMFRRDSGGFSLPFDLPLGVPAGDASVESLILSHRDPQSDYNIFFVHKVYDPTNKGVTVAYSPGDPNGPALSVLNCCIMPDISGWPEVAHELGHFLLNGYPLLDPRYPNTGHPKGAPRDNLMTTVPNTSSVNIPKPQANFMNPSGNP